MVLTKTPEYKKLIEWRDSIVTYLTAGITLLVIAAALYYKTQLLIATMLIMLAVYAQQFAKIVSKMELFKHAPDATQNKIINHLPAFLLISGALLLLIS